MRLIDADALCVNLEEVYCKGCNSYDGVKCRACNISDAVGYIDDAPTVEPKKAVWADDPQADFLIRCSECFFITTKSNGYRYNYCPCCGSKMEVEP